MFRGRPVAGALFGFFFFLFVALDLLFFGVVPLNSAVITILPILGIVAGLVWAKVAPLSRRGDASSPAKANSTQ